jgi:hypothetical protein
MMGATQGVPKIDTLISVQGAYPIRITDAGVLTCDDVIKVPLGCVAKRQTVIDKGSYNIIPVVELAIPIEYLVFEIITNEGATVEPFSTLKLPDEANPYNGVRIYFVLPPGTTGIKDVIFKPKYPGMRAVLQFEVLPPPYNYDNALFGVITSAVSELDGRVDALESKRLYVKQVPLKSYPGFFQIFGTNDQNGILGWEFTFTNTGNMLTLTSGDLGSNASNTILNGVDIAESKKLTLTYDKGSSIFSLYDITEGVTGNILSQRYLASGLGRTTGAPQRLHLIIDSSEQNVLNIGSGFVSHI